MTERAIIFASACGVVAVACLIGQSAAPIWLLPIVLIVLF